MTTAALLLASGHSRRFGAGNKLLADLDGRPVISYAADAIRGLPIVHSVATVRDPGVAALLRDFDLCQLGRPEEDLSASIRAGIARCLTVPVDKILIVLGDMPGVTTRHLCDVVGRCSAATPSATLFDGIRMPPACFPWTLAGELMSLTGDKGAGILLQRLPRHALVEATAELTQDIDTIADLG